MVRPLLAYLLPLLLLVACVERYDDFEPKDAAGGDGSGCVPSGDDTVGDGIDQNCDGLDGVDADGDGFASVASGGDDCDDDNSAAFPGATDFVEGTCADLQLAPVMESVDAEGDAGYYSSAAIGPTGDLFVAYRSSYDESADQVRLARRTSGSSDWQFYTVFEGVGRYVSLAVAADAVHVAFHEADEDRVTYMRSALSELGSGNWETIVVDDTDGDPGRYASLFVESSGVAHVTYWNKGQDDLYYANNSSGAFVPEIVAGKDLVEGEEERIGNFSALTIDSTGKAHISTYNSTFERLEYLTNASGAWARTPIDASKPQIGKYTSIAVDSLKGVHISYRDKLLEDLRYATNSSGNWTIEVVDGEADWVGSYSAIAVDAEDNIHITYNEGDTDYLRYATRRDNRWAAAVVESSVPCGLQNSMVIDGQGVAHLFTGHNNLGELLHVEVSLECLAYDEAGDTNCDGVDGLDADGDGYPSVVSGGADCNDNDVDVQPAWVTRPVPDSEAEVGEFVALAIDQDNVLHAAYYAALTHDLKYARREPTGDWVIQTANAEGKVGKYAAIAVGDVPEDSPDGHPPVHIAYYSESSGELWHSVGVGASWTNSVVHATPEAGDDVGRFAAIALDEDGVAHISYADYANATLGYATNAGGTWSTMSLPTGVEAGSYSKIAVADGMVHIVFQAGNDDLMYMAAPLPVSGPEDFGAPDLVDGTNSSVGEALSMAVDGDGRVHVTYRDSSTRHLHYAQLRIDNWMLRTIDSNADVGKYSALDLDGNDMVHVAYKDQDTNALLYATNVVMENSEWFKEPVSGEGESVCGGLANECGDHASLRFDGIGQLHALHYDTTNGRLLYSRKSCLGY